MKILIASLCLCVLFKITLAISTEEARKAFLSAGEECSQKITIDEEEMKTFKVHKLLASHNGKCFQACVMKKLGVMTADNKASKEGFLVGISLVYPNDPLIHKLAEEVYAECADVTDEDECEAGNKIGGCLKEGKKNKGLDKEMD